MSKKTLLQIITHHRQNPLDFMNTLIHFIKTIPEPAILQY
jgi:hypothetical protein